MKRSTFFVKYKISYVACGGHKQWTFTCVRQTGFSESDWAMSEPENWPNER